MKQILFVGAMLIVSQQMGRAAIVISCQGSVCGGGGANQFQYELLNTGPNVELITSFTITTEDLNQGNYTAWTAPLASGWQPVGTVAGGGGGLLNVNSGVQTPHGGNSPAPLENPAGTVTWTIAGGDNIPNGGTRTFGFDFINPNTYEDGSWTVGTYGVNWASPVAGPVIFTDGPIHTAVPEPASSAAVVAGALLLIPVWRRWKASKQ